MPAFNIDISDEDYAAVVWAASQRTDLTPEAYLQQQFQAAVLTPAMLQMRAAQSPVPVADITMAYVTADTAVQEQVRSMLGVEIPPPPPDLSQEQPA